MSNVRDVLERALRQRILMLDGAMGTMIQRQQLDESGFRGTRFADHGQDLQGDNDLLVLTQPQIIEQIHSEYLEAGADIIETNTFNGTAIAQADYALEAIVYELNREAARVAKQAASRWSAQTLRFRGPQAHRLAGRRIRSSLCRRRHLAGR